MESRSASAAFRPAAASGSTQEHASLLPHDGCGSGGGRCGSATTRSRSAFQFTSWTHTRWPRTVPPRLWRMGFALCVACPLLLLVLVLYNSNGIDVEGQLRLPQQVGRRLFRLLATPAPDTQSPADEADWQAAAGGAGISLQYGVSPVLTYSALRHAKSFCLLPEVEQTWRFDQAFYDRVYERQRNAAGEGGRAETQVEPATDTMVQTYSARQTKEKVEPQQLQQFDREWKAVEQSFVAAASPASDNSRLPTMRTRLDDDPVCERTGPSHFSAHISANRYVHVQGCTRRNAHGEEVDADPYYSLKHGHAAPPDASLTAFRSGHFKMPDDASYVYVYCLAEQPAVAGAENSDDKSAAEHRPLLLHALPRIPHPPSPPPSPRRHIFLLQLDALSRARLPILMPRTYRLLQRLKQHGDAEAAGWEEEEEATEGSKGMRSQRHAFNEEEEVNGSPRRAHLASRSAVGSAAAAAGDRSSSSLSGQVALEFRKFTVVGHNSLPHMAAMFASRNNGQLEDSVPHDELLWNIAHKQGYVTAMGESECGDGSPISHFGFDLRQPGPTPPETKSHIDHNLVNLFCTERFQPYRWDADPPRCMLGRPMWRHAADALMQMVKLYEDSPNPLFLWFNFNEAHEETGMGARHMDDDGFDRFVSHLLGSRFMRHALFLMLSDHGIHYGHHRDSTMTGLQENASPFLYVLRDVGVISPMQALRQRANSQQLVTSFDLYATLRAELEGRPAEPAATPNTYNVLHSPIPRSRTCEQTRMPCHGVDGSRQLSHRCQCETPFTQGCPKPNTVQPNLWHHCTQLWSHPLIFDAEWYSAHSGAGPFASPCAALYHWCQFGIYSGLSGTASFNPLVYQQLNVELVHHANLRLEYVRYYLEHAAESEQGMQAAGGRRRLRTRDELDELIAAHTNTQLLALANSSSSSSSDGDAKQLFAVHPDLFAIVEQHAVSKDYDVQREDRREWLSAVARAQLCPGVAASSKTLKTDAASSSVVPPPHPRLHAEFIFSAMQHLYSWCVFDESRGAGPLSGWQLSGRGCFRPFSAAHDTEHECIAKYSHLKRPVPRDNRVNHRSRLNEMRT